MSDGRYESILFCDGPACYGRLVHGSACLDAVKDIDWMILTYEKRRENKCNAGS